MRNNDKLFDKASKKYQRPDIRPLGTGLNANADSATNCIRATSAQWLSFSLSSLSLSSLFLPLLSFSFCLSISHPLSPRNISPLIVLSAHSYSNIDTSSIGRRGLSRGSFRAPRDIIESPDDNGARGRQWRSSCSSEVFRNWRGANNTGRALLSFSRCIGDEASTIPLRPIAQRRREGSRECVGPSLKKGEK